MQGALQLAGEPEGTALSQHGRCNCRENFVEMEARAGRSDEIEGV